MSVQADFVQTQQKLSVAGELGILLGVGRTRVTQLNASAWLPRPTARLLGGSGWELTDVQGWAADAGCTLDHPAQAAHIATRDSSAS